MKGKVIIITGANGGMGKYISYELAKSGATLALCDRSEDIRELGAECGKLGGDVIVSKVDVTDESQVQTFFEAVRERYGAADALLNLAGLSIPAKISDMEADQYDLTLDVNLKGTFLCSKHFVGVTQPEKGAKIINIGSMAAKRANANAPMYCTAKAAVNMFSQGLALQVKEQNIRVTTLNPGAVDTAFWGTRQVPRERFMKPEDMYLAIKFVLDADPRIVIHEINFESFLQF